MLGVSRFVSVVPLSVCLYFSASLHYHLDLRMSIGTSGFVVVAPLLSGFVGISWRIRICWGYSSLSTSAFVEDATLLSGFIVIDQCVWVFCNCSILSMSRFVGTTPLLSGYVEVDPRFRICWHLSTIRASDFAVVALRSSVFLSFLPFM